MASPSPTSPRPSRTGFCAAWRKARSRARPCRRAFSSICSSTTRSKASSPTRSTAATATSSAGSWSAFRAWRRCTPRWSTSTACPTRSSRYRSSTCSKDAPRPTSTATRSTSCSRERTDMATKLKPVDAVIVGVGLSGTILAKELAEAGLQVVGLERGRWRDTDPDFAMPHAHDELRYVKRHELMQDLSRETITFRNNAAETALPMRQLGSFRPGEGVGGAAVHWGGLTWRFLPWDFETRSRTLARYGKEHMAADCTSQDWGVTYDEPEPPFDRFDSLYGISGKAGTLKGKIVPGGNPFEGPRSRDYPNPPLKTSFAGSLFKQTAEKLGYKPFPTPSGALSRPYTNEYGATINAC